MEVSEERRCPVVEPLLYEVKVEGSEYEVVGARWDGVGLGVLAVWVLGWECEREPGVREARGLEVGLAALIAILVLHIRITKKNEKKR